MGGYSIRRVSTLSNPISEQFFQMSDTVAFETFLKPAFERSYMALIDNRRKLDGQSYTWLNCWLGGAVGPASRSAGCSLQLFTTAAAALQTAIQ